MEKLPQFRAREAIKDGVVETFTLDPRESDDWFAMEFFGYPRAPRDGLYTFFTTSDEGSQLFIGDRLVVDNDGLHGKRERSGKVALKAGCHPIRVTYFEVEKEQFLNVEFAGPEVERQAVPQEVLFHD